MKFGLRDDGSQRKPHIIYQIVGIFTKVFGNFTKAFGIWQTIWHPAKYPALAKGPAFFTAKGLVMAKC